MSNDDGWSAFPREDYQDHRARGQCGMSLRDYFAGRVLGQCQITVDTGNDAPTEEEIRSVAARYARAAYIIADAMLKERQIVREVDGRTRTEVRL